MRLRLLAVLAILGAASFLANAGPFGLDKGMTLDELKRHGTFVPGNAPLWYKAKSLKQGHPAFEAYDVLVTPEDGLCKIVAIGVDIPTNSFGEQVRSQVESLTEALSSKYGQPSDKFDFLQSGSIWRDRNDFMMGLYKEERVLANFWNAKKTPLPDNLQGIGLSARALTSSKAYVSLTYEFNGSSTCTEKSKARTNSNL